MFTAVYASSLSSEKSDSQQQKEACHTAATEYVWLLVTSIPCLETRYAYVQLVQYAVASAPTITGLFSLIDGRVAFSIPARF